MLITISLKILSLIRIRDVERTCSLRQLLVHLARSDAVLRLFRKMHSATVWYLHGNHGLHLRRWRTGSVVTGLPIMVYESGKITYRLYVRESTLICSLISDSLITLTYEKFNYDNCLLFRNVYNKRTRLTNKYEKPGVVAYSSDFTRRIWCRMDAVLFADVVRLQFQAVSLLEGKTNR